MAKCIATFVLTALILAFNSGGILASSDDEHIVLAPVDSKSSLPEKMLVFIPGGKVPNERYVATARAIQESTNQLKLWVVIPAVFQRLCIISCSATSVCSPLHSAVEAALDMATKQGWTRGKDSVDTWLAGHSLGGVCANTLFQAYSQESSFPYAGLVIMGSYVDEAGSHDLLSYPKPVLTLNVELDGGLARPGKTAVWWRQHLAIEATKGEEYALLHKPVIVLPKLNHSNFCPGFDVPGDLMGEIPQAQATQEIGSVIAAFLHAQTSSVSAQTLAPAALGVLRSKISWTREFLAPYLKAQDYERQVANIRISAEGASPLCAEAQHIVAGLSEKDDERLRVEDGFHVKSSNLEHCHPNWTATASGNLTVRSCSHTDYYADVANTGSITAASEIACKMLSSDRVAQQLNTTADRPKVECKEVNRHVVRLAESIAATSTLERYRKSGRGWCFLADEPVTGSIGPVWVFVSELQLKSNATCMTVASPVLKTELDGKIFPGNHYCKVLSPARVLDWMMTDSLKKEGLRLEPAAADSSIRADTQVWV